MNNIKINTHNCAATNLFMKNAQSGSSYELLNHSSATYIFELISLNEFKLFRTGHIVYSMPNRLKFTY